MVGEAGLLARYEVPDLHGVVRARAAFLLALAEVAPAVVTALFACQDDGPVGGDWLAAEAWARAHNLDAEWVVATAHASRVLHRRDGRRRLVVGPWSFDDLVDRAEAWSAEAESMAADWRATAEYQELAGVAADAEDALLPSPAGPVDPHLRDRADHLLDRVTGVVADRMGWRRIPTPRGDPLRPYRWAVLRRLGLTLEQIVQHELDRDPMGDASLSPQAVAKAVAPILVALFP